MPIDWSLGFVGGLMIGSAAAIFLLFNGRIMGASGMLGGLIDRSGWSSWSERVAFAGGLVVVPGGLAWMSGGASTHAASTTWVVIAAGLLVGLGTRLANGCTSGHGVCGLSRFSRRSIVATAIYLFSGMLCVWIFKHLLGAI